MSNSKKKTIMKKCFVMVAAISSMMALSGCSEQVNNEVITEEISWGIPENQGLLRVQTRSATPLQEGKVYVFNSEGRCVRLLTADEGGQLASTTLAAGSYTVYAIGGEDLDAYTLPDQEGAAASSVITLAEGQTMGDLLMTATDVTLTAGNSSNLELELERQVIRLKEVIIKQVPTDVTQVELNISPLYEGIQLDGTPTETHTSLKIDLIKSSGNKTWTNGDELPYCFPSDGAPTITVSFTNSAGVKRYSYQTDESFTANHQVILEGTYSEEQDALLSGMLTAKAWDADKSKSFEFNENQLVDVTHTEPVVPVAGGTYLGYYVVSVGSGNAVLLSLDQVNNISSAEKMAQKAASISKPERNGITCGEWRLPTSEECRIFLVDPNVDNKKYNTEYYCQDGDILKRMRASISSEGAITIRNPMVCSDYLEDCYYRPVIDITY